MVMRAAMGRKDGRRTAAQLAIVLACAAAMGARGARGDGGCGPCALPAELRASQAVQAPRPFAAAPGENAWRAWSCQDGDGEATVLQLDGEAHVPVARNATRVWEPAALAVDVGFQDGGRSILLDAEGTGSAGALWTFGDTIPARGGAWFKNTALRVVPTDGGRAASFVYASTAPDNATAACLVGFNATLAPHATCDKFGLWPGAGATVDSSVFVWFQITSTPNVLGFAEAPLAPILAGQPYRFEWVSGESPFMAEMSLLDASDPHHIYLLFNQKAADNGDGSRTHLARVPRSAAAVRDLSRYEYFTALDGDSGAATWSPHFTDSVSVAPDVEVSQVSAAWNGYLDRFIMLTTGQWDDARKVYMLTAPHPWGPWSEKTVVYHLPGGMGDGFSLSLYCAYLHPELFAAGGRTVVFTYSIIPPKGEADAPHLVELALCTEEEAANDPQACLTAYLTANATAPQPPACPHTVPAWAWAVLVGGAAFMCVLLTVLRCRARQRRRARDQARLLAT